MNEMVDTIIIGAGHSGLGIGYCLAQKKRKFIILEKGEALTPAWRSRWELVHPGAAQLDASAAWICLPGQCSERFFDQG